jgi:ribosomal protein S18 acetylase RimI-like enzyme
MSPVVDAELYVRGAATLVASWEEYAREATDAAVVRGPGVAAAIFPCGPERSVYNNALFDRDLDALQRAGAIDAMETAYAQASITSFAAWVHESDSAMRAELAHRRYTLTESTRAMAMALDDIDLPRPDIDFAPPNWSEYLRVIEVSPHLLSRGDHAAFHILIARLDGDSAAAAMAFDLGTDCGIYNVGTLEHARRRGLGTALTVAHLYDAVDRGCRTASLQSTPMAERVYAAAGFRDLGRILEYAP